MKIVIDTVTHSIITDIVTRSMTESTVAATVKFTEYSARLSVNLHRRCGLLCNSRRCHLRNAK